MPVYMIAEIQVTDPEAYGRYVEAAQAIVLRHGGRYHVRGGKVIPLAGQWHPERVLVLEFDSLERLRACFDSEEYRRISPLRERSTIARSIIVEGCGQSPNP